MGFAKPRKNGEKKQVKGNESNAHKAAWLHETADVLFSMCTEAKIKCNISVNNPAAIRGGCSCKRTHTITEPPSLAWSQTTLRFTSKAKLKWVSGRRRGYIMNKRAVNSVVLFRVQGGEERERERQRERWVADGMRYAICDMRRSRPELSPYLSRAWPSSLEKPQWSEFLKNPPLPRVPFSVPQPVCRPSLLFMHWICRHKVRNPVSACTVL